MKWIVFTCASFFVWLYAFGALLSYEVYCWACYSLEMRRVLMDALMTDVMKILTMMMSLYTLIFEFLIQADILPAGSSPSLCLPEFHLQQKKHHRLSSVP